MISSSFRKRNGTYRGTKLCMCFEVKVLQGACVHILDCRLSYFFFSSVADVALMARSLHVSKQTKLCTGTKSP